MSKTEKMPVSKARQVIERLPSRLKAQATRWLNKKMVDRRGSEHFAKEHPKRGVTPEQRQFIRQLHRYGVSFRAIETIMHLVHQDGNDAQRQCWAAGEKKPKARSTAGNERRKANRMRAHAVA